MILRAEICKALPVGELEKPAKNCCTYRCTRVEISRQLAHFIAAWPKLSKRQQEALLVMATAAESVGSYCTPIK
jgi:hypothetical protein